MMRLVHMIDCSGYLFACCCWTHPSTFSQALYFFIFLVLISHFRRSCHTAGSTIAPCGSSDLGITEKLLLSLILSSSISLCSIAFLNLALSGCFIAWWWYNVSRSDVVLYTLNILYLIGMPHRQYFITPYIQS